MPNLLSNLSECFGFSQIMKSTFCKIFIALKLISSRFPMGVDIKYSPFLRSFILFLLTFIISCSPQNYLYKDNVDITENTSEKTSENVMEKIIDDTNEGESFKEINELEFSQTKISNEIEVLLPKLENYKVTKDFINAFELSLYKKNIKNINLNINLYSNKKELDNIISEKISPGKIFIGPLTSTDTENLINRKYVLAASTHNDEEIKIKKQRRPNKNPAN